MHFRTGFGVIALAVAGSAASAQVNFGALGYFQNFDSMGTAGTSPPAGWRVMTGNSGTSNTTWATTIPGNGTNSVASMVAAPTPLTASTSPTANNNNGYNAARSTSALTDRVLATAPTTVSGAALELTLTNDRGLDFPAGFQFDVSFDTVRFTTASTANELPGYWLFWSLDGTTWTNVAALNPTIATVPNTVGITTTTGTVALTGAWTAGSQLRLRWVDDNALQTSPDQIIGLNNVSFVPAPGAAALVGLGLLTAGRRRR